MLDSVCLVRPDIVGTRGEVDFVIEGRRWRLA